MTRRVAFGTPAPLWILVALAVALLAATQPVAIGFAALALTALALLGVITPLSTLAVLLILAPLRTLVETEAPGTLPLDVGQLALAALVGFWVIQSLVRRRALPRLEWSPVYIPVLLFVVATGLTAFSAVSLGFWLNEWLKWVSMLVLIAICLDLGAWEWLVFVLVVAGVANALIGIYEYFGGSGALHLIVNETHFRAFGTFGQPNPFGGFMGLLAPIALAAAAGYSYRLWRTWRATRTLNPTLSMAAGFYWLAAALLTAGVFLSWSRGSWLGFGAALGAMLLALPRKWWHGVAPVALALAVVVVLWLSGRLPASIVTRIESVTDEIASFQDVRGVDVTPENYANVERLAHWQAALNMAQANPWLGVGFGNYEIAYPTYNLLYWRLALGHAHNYYLNVFAEAGIIGLASYLALWGAVMALTWRARRQPDPLARLVVVGLFGTWTYLAVHSLTDNLYVNNLFLHLGVMLGILAVLRRIQCVRME